MLNLSKVERRHDFDLGAGQFSQANPGVSSGISVAESKERSSAR